MKKGVFARRREFSVDDLHCLTDLHLHLDGAISLSSMRELAKMQGITLPESEEELLAATRVGKDCGDLESFLQKFNLVYSLLQTKDGIRRAVQNLLAELKEQGLMYAELRFAPQISTQKGLSQEEVVLAALEGIRDADIGVNLILCCMRGDDNAEENLETLRVAEKYLGKGVAAIDLAGAEYDFPTANFAGLFRCAAEKNIPFTVHAGEADGPDSVRSALEFDASRIGHGVRACEDADLLGTLAEKQIPLELCPTSNLYTGIAADLEHWPLKTLLEAGVSITVNSDDPAIENTTVKEEYKKLIRCFGLDKACVKRILENSVNASFASPGEKKKMRARIRREFRRK